MHFFLFLSTIRSVNYSAQNLLTNFFQYMTRSFILRYISENTELFKMIRVENNSSDFYWLREEGTEI
jgi:hypothetical protein